MREKLRRSGDNFDRQNESNDMGYYMSLYQKIINSLKYV